MTHDPYAVLVALAERERALVDGGRFDELEALAAERAAVIAGLPPQAPPSARPALERALTIQAATAAVLQASVAEVRQQLGTLHRRSGATRAYAVGPATPAASAVNTAA